MFSYNRCRPLCRPRDYGTSIHTKSTSSAVLPQVTNEKNPDYLGPEAEAEAETKQKSDCDSVKSMEFHADDFEGKGASDFPFTFRFQTYDEFYKSHGGYGDSNCVKMEECREVSTINTRKYEFIAEKGHSGFMERPEALNCSIKEMYSSGCQIDVPEVLSFPETGSGLIGYERNNYPGDGDVSDDSPSLIHPIIDSELNGFRDNKDVLDESQSNIHPKIGSVQIDDGDVSDASQPQILPKDMLSDLESDSESTNFSREPTVTSPLMDPESMTSSSEFLDEEESDEEVMKEFKQIEREAYARSDFVRQENTESSPSLFNLEDSGEIEDPNELETLWEHQELVEQLNMELKKVRATGLPTIFEEETEQCPKMIMEDLKPWKIDEKFHQRDRMSQLHKFYRSYRERMRKLDILNYQKMYAIGVLQLKDPLQSILREKCSGPTITAFLSRNFRILKRKKNERDPTMKFAAELYNDLEAVYVGHLCLSWEFLHWQYEKALELWESDPHGICRYNEVAGEFQQFQVLMQWFIENEPFQGPRVQNYVRTRCVHRNLLQVPVIREDGFKGGKNGTKRGGVGAITSDMLVDIMEESIRNIWRFVRTDADADSTAPSNRNITQIELQNPSDLEQFLDIRVCLRKKEKRLKDLSRTGSCILKKFGKCRQDDSDQVLYFFSQVDMKLVRRVLNMSRITTDQLVWCRSKLNKINFVNRKLQVEPLFLLFPC